MERTSVDQLPDEVLLEMFTYLSHHDLITCAQVCQRWQSVTCSKCLWRNVQYGGNGDNKLKEAFEITKLARGFRSLTLELSHGTCVVISNRGVHLSLSPLAWVAFKPTIVEAVERLSPDLTEVTVSGTGRVEHHIRLLRRVLLAVPFSHLRSFTALDPCGVAVDDPTLATLCARSPLLETLILQGCSSDLLTPTGGLAHLRLLPKLRVLRLERKLSSADFGEMAACLNAHLRRPESALHCSCKAHDLSFLKHCRKLTSLLLSPCNEFAYRLPDLRDLILKCEEVQAVGDRLDGTVRGLPHLEKLSLLGHWRVGDDHMQKIRAVAPVSYTKKTHLSSTGNVFLCIGFSRC